MLETPCCFGPGYPKKVNSWQVFITFLHKRKKIDVKTLSLSRGWLCAQVIVSSNLPYGNQSGAFHSFVPTEMCLTLVPSLPMSLKPKAT